MTIKHFIQSLALVALAGCGGQTEEGDLNIAPAGPYLACDAQEHIGGFEMTLKDTFTAVQGTVTNAVRPSDVPEVTSTDSACKLLQPKTLFCDPMCGSGQTCGDDGECVDLPSNQSVGSITITGLSAPVEMDARAPVYFYNHVGELPHPAFAEGGDIFLSATGDSITPFTLATRGVSSLTLTTDTMQLERDAPSVLDWLPGEPNESVQVEIELNIANHGGTPAKVVCTSDDSGHFEIPASMVNGLLDLGFSGFPSVELTRVASNITQTDYGCVDFRAQSSVVLSVDIPGLISCSESSDCPADQTCQDDLTCN